MNKVKQLVCEKDDDLSNAIFSLGQGKVWRYLGNKKLNSIKI